MRDDINVFVEARKDASDAFSRDTVCTGQDFILGTAKQLVSEVGRVDEGVVFSPEIAKIAQEDGFTKGASLADGVTLARAITINYWLLETHKEEWRLFKWVKVWQKMLPKILKDMLLVVKQ